MEFELAYTGEEINDLLGKAKTALQKKDIASLATKQEVRDVEAKIDNFERYDDSEVYKKISEVEQSIPTKVSQLDNDKGYLTEHQSLKGLATESYVDDKVGSIKFPSLEDYAKKEEIPSLDGYATEQWVKQQDYLTEHQSLIHLATKKELEGKVDKVDGKQLSTEDFTTVLKAKLEELKNYDDSELVSRIDAIQETIDTLFSKDASSAIESFNEITAFLDGLKDTQNLAGIIAAIEQQIADVAKAIPTKVSELTNDSGFLTEHQDISHLATKSAVGKKQDAISDLDTIREGAAKGATAVQPSSLAKVATSGSYNDLSNKPTIPSAVTESTVSGWGFTKNTGTYSKPSGGIPKTDLASAVQTSLGKADTALQSVPDTYATKTNLAEALAPIGTLYKGAWIAEKTEGISQKYTEIITLPAGTYIISVVLPYAKVGHGNQICIGFSANMAIGMGNTFLDASYGCTTQLAVFTTTTNLCVTSAASANTAEWAYLERGGIAALRVK